MMNNTGKQITAYCIKYAHMGWETVEKESNIEDSWRRTRTLLAHFPIHTIGKMLKDFKSVHKTSYLLWHQQMYGSARQGRTVELVMFDERVFFDKLNI